MDYPPSCSFKKNSDYIFHLSLDLVIAALATLWVLFVFIVGGWLISLWKESTEHLVERGSTYTNRAAQALQEPTGDQKLRNIYFGLIMGVSTALPTFTFNFAYLVDYKKD